MIVEDELSESILNKLIANAAPSTAFAPTLGKSGYGFIKKRINGLNAASRGIIHVVLTDLDRDKGPCAPHLIDQWFEKPIHENMIFRVAVSEVESWILADPTFSNKFLGLKYSIPTTGTDSLEDPKKELLLLAEKSRFRKIREAISVRNSNNDIRQGPDYNNVLSQFVRGHWDPDKARENSESLHRAIVAIDNKLSTPS